MSFHKNSSNQRSWKYNLMHISKYFEENIPFFNAFDMLGQSIHILNSTGV